MNKRIANLTIKGLNTSMPDSTVPDGACDVLNNMRFRDGSWRNVGKFSLTSQIDLPNLPEMSMFEYLGIHEIDGVVHCVGKGVGVQVPADGNVLFPLHLFVYHDGAWEDLGEVARHHSPSASLAIDIHVHAFGKVLIVGAEDVMRYYVWNKGKYSLFQMPEPARVHTTSIATYDREWDAVDKGFHFFLLDKESGDVLNPISNQQLGWWGEICYLVAYRMTDGTIIAPSDLYILCSEGKDSWAGDTVISSTTDDNDREYITIRMSSAAGSTATASKRLRYFYPTIFITIPKDIDTSLVDRVAIYSTSIHNIYDYDRILNNRSKNPSHSLFYADNELPNKPMYLVVEEKIGNISNGEWRVKLGYDVLKDLTSKVQRYKPAQIHQLNASALYDYNARIHYGNITTTLYAPYPTALVHPYHVSNVYKERIVLDDLGSVLSHPLQNGGQGWPEEVGEFPIRMETPILSYPDYRATSIEFVSERTDEICEDKKMLRAATANNFAYYITPTDGVVKYPQESFKVDRSIDSIPAISPTFSEPNRIQVSAPNNPFSLPFENSYAVGNEGSKVLAMNTVADSLVDSNFYGNYPLYIFTTDGIFALRSGSGEVLYAGTEIINHDKITNPETIALNGSVVYACSEGLKALTGRQGVRISADIDPIDWDSAQLGVNWEYGELVCRLASGDILVWNIAAGAWSQRTSVAGNLADGHIAVLDNNDPVLLIYDINEEEEGSVSISIRTRPLKFEGFGFKKVEMMLARLASVEGCMWTIKVESSNDCKNWATIKNVTVEGNTKDLGLRRFAQSARFYRLSIDGIVLGNVPITQIDWVIQDRYNNKLR